MQNSAMKIMQNLLPPDLCTSNRILCVLGLKRSRDDDTTCNGGALSASKCDRAFPGLQMWPAQAHSAPDEGAGEF